jgi:hypothetical protein
MISTGISGTEAASSGGSAIDKLLDGRYIISILLKRAWVLGIAALVGCALALLYVQMSPQRYSIQMIVTPVDESSAEGVAGQIGAIAASVGVDLGGRQSASLNQFQLYLMGLTSRAVARDLSADSEIMQRLYPSEWNSDQRQWQRPPLGFLGRATTILRSIFGRSEDNWHPPDAERVETTLRSIIDVTVDSSHPFIATVSANLADASTGILLLQKLHTLSDDHLRTQALQRSQQYISYLTKEVANVSQAEQRAAILNSLNEQEKMAMASGAGPSYAAAVFDGPSVYPAPSSTLRLIVTCALASVVLTSFVLIMLEILGIALPLRADPE